MARESATLGSSAPTYCRVACSFVFHPKLTHGDSCPSPWVSKLTKYFENFTWGWGKKKIGESNTSMCLGWKNTHVRSAALGCGSLTNHQRQSEPARIYCACSDPGVMYIVIDSRLVARRRWICQLTLTKRCRMRIFFARMHKSSAKGRLRHAVNCMKCTRTRTPKSCNRCFLISSVSAECNHGSTYVLHLCPHQRKFRTCVSALRVF